MVALTFAISVVVRVQMHLGTPDRGCGWDGIGAKNNILIKDAATLENTSRLTAIVLDKTGTLTEGKPKVTNVIAFNGFIENDVMKYEASMNRFPITRLRKQLLMKQKRGVLSSFQIPAFNQ